MKASFPAHSLLHFQVFLFSRRVCLLEIGLRTWCPTDVSGQNIYLGSFLWNAIRMAPSNMYESIQRHLWASVTIREKSDVQISTSHNCRKYRHKASPCHHLAMLSTVSMSSRSFCLGHIPLDWIQPSPRDLWDGSHLSGDLRILAADDWTRRGSGSRNHYLVRPVSLTHLC